MSGWTHQESDRVSHKKEEEMLQLEKKMIQMEVAMKELEQRWYIHTSL